jgi:DNA-binding NarL/FixJ family response regulator
LIRLLLVDDHTLFRKGLRQICELESDLEVVGEAGSGAEAVQVAKLTQPDVVLMDINLPGMDGVEATRRLLQALPQTKVVILTMHRQDKYVFEAIKAGAQGYLLKDSETEELLEAIRAVHRGEALLDPSMAIKVLDEFKRLQELADRPKELEELSDREVEILRLVGEGLSNDEIAARLFLSEKTVRNRLSIIFQKLQVNNRTQAALLAQRAGLVKPLGTEDE